MFEVPVAEGATSQVFCFQEALGAAEGGTHTAGVVVEFWICDTPAAKLEPEVEPAPVSDADGRPMYREIYEGRISLQECLEVAWKTLPSTRGRGLGGGGTV